MIVLGDSTGDPATVAGMEKETITTIKIGYLNHKVCMWAFLCLYLFITEHQIILTPLAKMLEYVWDWSSSSQLESMQASAYQILLPDFKLIIAL